MPQTVTHMGSHRPSHHRGQAASRSPLHHSSTKDSPISITAWRIVAALTLLTAIAAGLIFAAGLKANADSAPTSTPAYGPVNAPWHGPRDGFESATAHDDQ